MTERPWIKWYPADWRAEPRLRIVSRSARSLWLDMIGLMHEADPYGHLLIAGMVPNAQQLASVLGDSERDVTKWLAELERAGVFDRTSTGTIVSRRMVRDKKRADTAAENGKAGGNPSLKGSDNPRHKRPDKWHDNRDDNVGLKAQKPEAKDFGPKGQSRRPEARERAGERDAPAPLALTQKMAGWWDEFPQWSAFKATLKDGEWLAWFADSKLNGSEFSLLTSGEFAKDQLRQRYQRLLDEHFGRHVSIRFEPEVWNPKARAA